MVVWITGLTASGKTTLGKLLEKKLINFGYKGVLRLDGDELRQKKKLKNGHSIDDRWFNLKLIVEVVTEELSINKTIIVSTVSHLKEMRSYARMKLLDFHEVYLDCTPENCAKRDYKSLYENARKNMILKHEIFPGVTEPYQLSKNPELLIDTNINDVNKSFEKLFQYCLKNITE